MKTQRHEVGQSLENLKEACRKAGVKCTYQRMEIYREVVNNPVHPDAETVFRQVRSRLANISLDTVYRTLWLLRDLGLVITLGAPYERTRFDANLSLHHHFICTRCGRTIDFYSKELDELKISDHVRGLGQVHVSQVILHGVCIECAGGGKETETHRKR